MIPRIPAPLETMETKSHSFFFLLHLFPFPSSFPAPLSFAPETFLFLSELKPLKAPETLIYHAPEIMEDQDPQQFHVALLKRKRSPAADSDDVTDSPAPVTSVASAPFSVSSLDSYYHGDAQGKEDSPILDNGRKPAINGSSTTLGKPLKPLKPLKPPESP